MRLALAAALLLALAACNDNARVIVPNDCDVAIELRQCFGRVCTTEPILATRKTPECSAHR